MLWFLLVLGNLQFQIGAVGVDVGRHDFYTVTMEGVEDVVMQL